jgi:hypothetical protein
MKAQFFILLFAFAAAAQQQAEVRYYSEPGADGVEMFENPDKWEKARARIHHFGMFGGWLEENGCGKVCKNNSFQRLVQADAFRKLMDWGIKIDVGLGSVKPGSNCDAKDNARGHAQYIERVKNVGGKISSFTMDWPLASGRFDCNQSMDQTAEYVADYVKYVKAVYAQVHQGEELQVGLWEGYPLFSHDELIQWLETLRKHGFVPSHIVLDIDRDAHKGKKRNDAYMKMVLTKVLRYCSQKGIKFGIAFWSNDLKNPATYRQDIINWVRVVKKTIGAPELIEFNSWEYWVQFGNEGNVFPENLPDSNRVSHTGIMLEGLRLFGAK